jgi:hypothetical protein
MTEDLLSKNGRLRERILEVWGTHPQLGGTVRKVVDDQPETASPEQVQTNLQERARAIIKERPDLASYFDGLLPEK